MGHVDASSRVCPRCVWAGKLGFAGVSGGRKVLSSRNGAPQPDLGLMRNGRGIPGREDAGVVGCGWLWLWAVVGGWWWVRSTAATPTKEGLTVLPDP